MRYKIRVYDHNIECYIESKIIEAKSISSAAKLAEIHFAELQKTKVDVTLKIEELVDGIENNS